jgi:hypothetical protein
MNAWLTFWVVWLVLSGAAFLFITLVVAVKGFGDLRAMFTGLHHKESATDGEPEQQQR